MFYVDDRSNDADGLERACVQRATCTTENVILPVPVGLRLSGLLGWGTAGLGACVELMAYGMGLGLRLLHDY